MSLPQNLGSIFQYLYSLKQCLENKWMFLGQTVDSAFKIFQKNREQLG